MNKSPSQEEPSIAWTSTTAFTGLEEPPVAAGDRLVVVASGTVFVLDAYSGTPVGTCDGVLEQHFPYSMTSFEGGRAHPVASGGNLYFADGASIVALRLADGVPLTGWTSPTVSSVTAIAASGGRIIVSALDRAGATIVLAFGAVDGKPVFRGPITISERSPGPVAAGDGALFFVAGGRPHAVNFDFGDDRWAARPSSAGQEDFDLSVSPLVAGTTAVFAAGDLVALDTRSGQQRWRCAPPARAGQWRVPVTDAAGSTVVAVNSAGDVYGIAAGDGTVRWHVSCDAPSAPTIIGDHVYIPASGGTSLMVLSVDDGAAMATYSLPDAVRTFPPLVIDGTAFLIDARSRIVARSFAEQDAARFDGSSSRIDIPADGDQFDVGLGDFTIEAWFRSTVGGEIVSSYPTAAGTSGRGLRLNLTSDGEVRVAVIGPSPSVSNVARTSATNATDGAWHHVAFARRNGAFSVALDGTDITLRTPPTPAGPLPLDGTNALTIGAWRRAPDQAPDTHFRGLVREVRFWDLALDLATIQTNRTVELTGTEPHLKGLWRLDDQDQAPHNAVTGHRDPVSSVNLGYRPTALAMDRSAFPYLIHETARQWPYAGAWGARGEDPVSGAPAVAGRTVGFTTDNAIYGVRKDEGRRMWSVDVGAGASAPAADGERFLVLTGEDKVIAIDAATGVKTQLPAFAQLDTGTAGRPGGFCPPVVTADGRVAVVTPQGVLAVASRGARSAEQVATGVVAPTGLGAVPGFLVVAAAEAVVLVSVPDLAMQTLLGWSTFCAAGPWLVCAGSGRVARFLPGLGVSPVAQQAVESEPTGLAAWPDSDLLVAAAADGTVTGFSLAKLALLWTAQLPGGRAAEAPQFDDAGRIVCTSAAGTVAVLDPDDGSLLGLYREPQPVITAAVLDSGTAFYGCADPADPAAECDGALHSLVLGGVLALRLGVGADGMVQPGRAGHAVIEAGPGDAGLHLLDVHDSCLEAWINVPPAPAVTAATAAGGILGICPTTAQDAFDLSLWLDPDGIDGTVHYAAREAANGSWDGIHAAVTCAQLCDGRWHHLAVSRTAGNRVVIYLDGQPQADVTTDATTTAPSTTAPGLRAYLGAVADDDLAAARPWAGMIGEVRVWDTYLTATEISTRMHVKLRGDEPGLIAYWNFDHGAVHDGARQGHDGKLADTGAQPAWWLADLPFTQPSYPEITTSAAIFADDSRTTTYDLSITVHRADGSPLPYQLIDLWYVTHDRAEPETITIGGQSLVGVAPAHETDDTKLTVKSGPDGTVRLRVSTTLVGHGPSLDCRAPYMPANERFHINCLVDNQRMAKPTPPTLSAQTKLIQGYHFSPGGKIDETRDRTTHRVVLTAQDPQHMPLAAIPVTLWAASDVELEISGNTHPANKQNTVTVDTNAAGEVVIDIEASGFNAPTLYARAGFMARNDSILVSPADDAHAQLAVLQPATLTKNKVVNWSKTPDDKPPAAEPPLTGDYAPHAGEVASAVRTTMASVKPPPPARRVAATPPSFGDLRQPTAPVRADQAPALRTLADISRRPPVDADGLRIALGGHFGFEICCDGPASTFSYRLLTTQQEADLARGVPTIPRVRPLRGLAWYDFWDPIKDAGEDLYDGVKSIVITIGDKIEVAIKTMRDEVEHIVHAVVSTVEDAVDAVVGFFKALLLAIELIILFLRALFDWGGIRDATVLIKRMLHSTGGILSQELGKAQNILHLAFSDLNSLIGVEASAPSICTTDLVADAGITGTPEGLSLSNGVQAKALFHKLQDNVDVSSVTGPAGGSQPAGSDLLKGIEDFTGGLIDIMSDILDLRFDDARDAAVNLLKTLETDVVAGAERWVSTSLQALADSIEGILASLDTGIDIPFISQLFEWIFGGDLTMLDLLCFVIALPVHIVYFVATWGSRFSDDAKQWFMLSASNAKAPAARALASAIDFPSDTGDMEIVYAVGKSIHVLCLIISDATFKRQAIQGNEPGAAKLKSMFIILRCLVGMFTTAWAFTYTLSAYQTRLDDLGLQDGDTSYELRLWGGLVVGMLGDGIPLTAAISRLYSTVTGRPEYVEMARVRAPDDLPVSEEMAQEPATGDGFQLADTDRDLAELIGMIGLAAVALSLIIAEFRAAAKSPEFRTDAIEKVAYLLMGRSIGSHIPALGGWIFTQIGADLVRDPDTRAAVVAARGIANAASLVCHCVAGFDYLT